MCFIQYYCTQEVILENNLHITKGIKHRYFIIKSNNIAFPLKQPARNKFLKKQKNNAEEKLFFIFTVCLPLRICCAQHLIAPYYHARFSQVVLLGTTIYHTTLISHGDRLINIITYFLGLTLRQLLLKILANVQVSIKIQDISILKKRVAYHA